MQEAQREAALALYRAIDAFDHEALPNKQSPASVWCASTSATDTSCAFSDLVADDLIYELRPASVGGFGRPDGFTKNEFLSLAENVLPKLVKYFGVSFVNEWSLGCPLLDSLSLHRAVPTPNLFGAIREQACDALSCQGWLRI